MHGADRAGTISASPGTSGSSRAAPIWANRRVTIVRPSGPSRRHRVGWPLDELRRSAALSAGSALEHDRDPRPLRGRRALFLMRHLCAAIIASTFLLAGACAASGPAENRTAPSSHTAAMVESLPMAVATARTVGRWSEAGREGSDRIVITEHGFDQIVSRLYLQWLELLDEPSGARVLTTVGFDQLNDVPLYQLEIVATRELPVRLEVELEGSSPYTGEKRHFVVRAGPPA